MAEVQPNPIITPAQRRRRRWIIALISVFALGGAAGLSAIPMGNHSVFRAVKPSRYGIAGLEPAVETRYGFPARTITVTKRGDNISFDLTTRGILLNGIVGGLVGLMLVGMRRRRS